MWYLLFLAERPACVDCVSVDRQRCVVVFSRSLTVRDVTETYARISATTVMLSQTNELVYRKIYLCFQADDVSCAKVIVNGQTLPAVFSPIGAPTFSKIWVLFYFCVKF